MQPIALSSTVGRGIVHRAQEANPIVVDDSSGAVVDLPGAVRRAVVEARVLTIASFVLVLALVAVPYILFKRTVSLPCPKLRLLEVEAATGCDHLSAGPQEARPAPAELQPAAYRAVT